MSRRALVTAMAMALTGWVDMASTAPSGIAAPPRDTPPAAQPGQITGCPAIRAQAERTRIFDTTTLSAGAHYVNDHTLIFGIDRRWHLFGIFHQEPYDGEHEVDFVHAFSSTPDPAEWTAQSFQIAPGSAGIALSRRADLGETHLWAPHVVRVDGRYVMVYQSGGAGNDEAQIRMAESTDGVRWTRVGKAPLFEDICVARDPMLRRNGDLWTLYYTRCDSAAARQSGVAYRTSTDLHRWSAPRMAITLESTPPMFNSGYTESPFVFERGGFYYLSVTSYPVAGDATFVYCSRSPFAFREPPVARLAGHAAEWVFTDSGQAFMTHAGPGQGGVWMTPVAFGGSD